MLTAFNSTLSTARQRHPVIVPQLWTSLTHICFRPPFAAPHCHHTNTHHSLCSQGYSGVHLYTVKPSGFLVAKLLYKESIHVNSIKTQVSLVFKFVISVYLLMLRERNLLKQYWKWFREENLLLVGTDESILPSTDSLKNSLRQSYIFCISSSMCCTKSIICFHYMFTWI